MTSTIKWKRHRDGLVSSDGEWEIERIHSGPWWAPVTWHLSRNGVLVGGRHLQKLAKKLAEESRT